MYSVRIAKTSYDPLELILYTLNSDYRTGHHEGRPICFSQFLESERKLIFSEGDERNEKSFVLDRISSYYSITILLDDGSEIRRFSRGERTISLSYDPICGDYHLIAYLKGGVYYFDPEEGERRRRKKKEGRNFSKKYSPL